MASPLDEFEDVESEFEDVAQDFEDVKPEKATLLDRFKAGTAEGATGLLMGNHPQEFEGDASFFDRLAQSAGELTSDLPFNILGAYMGSALGGGAGSVAGPFGTATGSILGGGFGALALPTFLKEAMKEYQDFMSSGEDLSFGEFLQRADQVASGTLKSGFLGSILSMVSPAIPLLQKVPGLDRLLSYKAVKPAAEAALEAGVATVLPAAAEGRLPDVQDVTDAAALFLAIKAASSLPEMRRSLKEIKEVADLSKASDSVLEELKESKTPLEMQEKIERLAKVEEEFEDITSKAALQEETQSKAALQEEKPLEERVGEKVLSKETEPSFIEQVVPKGLRDIFEDFTAEVYDKNAPIRRLEEKDTPVSKSPSSLDELAKGFEGRALAALKKGVYDYNTFEITGKSFSDIFSKERIKEAFNKNKISKEKLDRYLASASSLDRINSGQKSALSKSDAESYVRENKAFKPFAEDLYAFQRNGLDNLEKAGLLSKEGKEAMTELYKSYAPLYRFMGEESFGLSKKTNKVNNPIKKTQGGSEKEILSPLNSIVKNRIAQEKAIAINDTMNALRDLLEKEGFKAEEAPKEKLSKEELTQKLGDEFEVGENQSSLSEAASIFDSQTYRPKEGVISGFRDGKRWKMAVPEEIARSFEDLSPRQANFLVDMVVKWKNMFSKGVTLPPGTIARLTGMDLIVSALQTKYPRGNLPLLEMPTRILYDFPKALIEVMKGGELYEKYLLSGAAQRALGGLDRLSIQGFTEELGSLQKPLPKDTKEWITQNLKELASLPKKLLHGLQKTSETLETATRLIEFKRSLDSKLYKDIEAKFPDKSKAEKERILRAGVDALNSTINYSKQGRNATINQMARMVPFMRAILNSGKKVIETLNPKTNPNWKSTYSQAVSYLTIPTLYLYLQNRNDPRYQALTQEERDRNLYLYLTNDPNEEPIKLRKIWEYGWLFQTLPEHLAEFLITQDPSSFKGLMHSFIEEVNPITVLPSSKVKLIPDRQQRMEASLQYTGNTSETAKKIGEIANVSPLYIDYAINMTGGSLGSFITQVADDALYAAGYSEDKRSEKRAADSLFWGTFFARGPKRTTQYSVEFYDLYNEMEKRRLSYESLMKQEQEEKAEKYRKEHPFLDMRKMKKEYSKFYIELDGIRNSTMTKQEKKKEENRIYLEMAELAKEFVSEVKKEMKDM